MERKHIKMICETGRLQEQEKLMQHIDNQYLQINKWKTKSIQENYKSKLL